MKFFLNITCPPDSPFSYIALEFAKSLINQGHYLHGIFFSLHAVELFSASDSPIKSDWHKFFKENHLTALVCSSAISKYLSQKQLPACVEIAGLGQFAELSDEADKVVSFGA